MSEKNQVTIQGRREVEVAILLLNNDKNNVTALTRRSIERISKIVLTN